MNIEELEERKFEEQLLGITAWVAWLMRRTVNIKEFMRNRGKKDWQKTALQITFCGFY